jgi:hypothetical protein
MWKNTEARSSCSQYGNWGHRTTENVQIFGDAFATARVEGVFMGQGSQQKYRVKLPNLSGELIREYGAKSPTLSGSVQRTTSKIPKMHGPQGSFQNAYLPIFPVPNMAYALERYLSSEALTEFQKQKLRIRTFREFLLFQSAIMIGARPQASTVSIVPDFFRQASFIKPLLAEQQRHVSCVGAGRD